MEQISCTFVSVERNGGIESRSDSETGKMYAF